MTSALKHPHQVVDQQQHDRKLQLETMTTHSTGLLVVVVCLWAPSLASAAPPKRVAVIGGGIGGASFAYYYRQAVPDAEVSPLHGTHKRT